MPSQPTPHVISHRHEPHELHARVRGKLLFLLAWPSLLMAMRRRARVTELWIGDSHAMSINRDLTNGMFMRAPGGVLILRAGARLMYSIGQTGFPPRVMRVARLVGRFGRPGALVPVFSAGEIDIRVHLPEHDEPDYAFVADYVEQCMGVARMLRAERVGFLVPMPPVDVPEEDTWFPINGTIAERVAIHARVREALRDAVARHPDAVLLDFTDVLADPTGAMPVEYTSDGAHTNARAVTIVRRELAARRLLPG